MTAILNLTPLSKPHSPSKMDQLTGLPTEILLLVCAYLPPADKATVSRVSKRLQHTVEPVLYADVHLKWIYPDFNNPPKVLLLKFINSPAIASCVERFQTGGRENYRIGQYPRASRLSDLEFEIISACARTAANTGHEEQWVRNVAGGDTDLYQALVLSQLPNITHLTISYQPDLQFRYVSEMFRRVLCSDKPMDGLSGFHHLKRVDIYVDMTFQDLGRLVGWQYELSDLLPFFYLPSIQDLRIVMPQDDESFSWPTTKPCSKSLTSLSLKRTNANVALLGRILAVTPHLKCLEYDFISATDSRSGPTSLCADGLGKALAHVRTTLEQLTISVHSPRSIGYGTEYFNTQVGTKGSLSLHDHESLVKLEVPIEVLLGKKPAPEIHLAGRLPPRIRRLYLTVEYSSSRTYAWWSKPTLELLGEYFSHYREHTADLETVGLMLDEGKAEWCSEPQRIFRKLCEEVHLTPELFVLSSDW